MIWGRLDVTKAVPFVDGRGEYSAALAALRGLPVSGVYALVDRASGVVLYVGESHTGRLYDTITRHFRRWRRDPARDRWARDYGGTEYDRREVAFVVELTDPAEAQSRQYELIQALRPRDNLTGVTNDEVPF